MLQALSDAEVKKMHKEMLDWVRKALASEDGSHVYNILLALKGIIDPPPALVKHQAGILLKEIVKKIGDAYNKKDSSVA